MLAELALGLFTTPPAYLTGWLASKATQRVWKRGLLGFWYTEDAWKERDTPPTQQIRDIHRALYQTMPNRSAYLDSHEFKRAPTHIDACAVAGRMITNIDAMQHATYIEHGLLRNSIRPYITTA